jgi:hypothetical protein
MRGSTGFYSPTRFVWMLLILLVIAGVYCFLKPLALSIDSAYGFLAYKGTFFFHSFNVLQVIPSSEIGRVDPVFMSWWSPGQWIFPGLLNYFFGIRLGVASIIITLASLIGGLIGYYRVFAFFRFSPIISLMSLLIIFSSSSLYYCFVVYQGGEILEFALFPWFLLYVLKLQKISPINLFVIAILFLLCFVAKTTLLVYCTLVLLAKIIMLSRSDSATGVHFSFKNLLLLLPVLLLTILVTLFYLSRGPHPSLINHFIISGEGFLIALSSPLNSLLSIQQWIERITKLIGGSLQGSGLALSLYYGLYLLVIVVLFWIIRSVILNKDINQAYKCFFIILYAGISAFFLFAYSFNTNIDFSSRHFKLMGYLFVPGLITVFYEKFRHSWIHRFVVLFCLISVIDIFYLKEKWVKNKYISIQYFYRNCDPPPYGDKLDKASYHELLDIGRQFTNKSEPVIFFVETSADIAIDLPHPFIIEPMDEMISEKVYHGSGPKLLVCISKNSFFSKAGLLQLKFPDYKYCQKIAETEYCLFFMCRNTN